MYMSIYGGPPAKTKIQNWRPPTTMFASLKACHMVRCACVSLQFTLSHCAHLHLNCVLVIIVPRNLCTCLGMTKCVYQFSLLCGKVKHESNCAEGASEHEVASMEVPITARRCFCKCGSVKNCQTDWTQFFEPFKKLTKPWPLLCLQAYTAGLL